MKYLFFGLLYFNSVFSKAQESAVPLPATPAPEAAKAQQNPVPNPAVPGTTVPVVPMPLQPNQNENQATVVPSEVITDKFQYDPTIGRDPFKIPLVNVDKFKPVPIINEDSLEGASIPDGVKVLAIIYDPKKPRALVQKLSNSKSYTVFNKSRLGEGGGIVSEIREDEIIIVRSVETEGQAVIENVVLRLKDKKRKIESK